MPPKHRNIGGGASASSVQGPGFDSYRRRRRSVSGRIEEIFLGENKTQFKENKVYFISHKGNKT